jgi:hypothetical protein
MSNLGFKNKIVLIVLAALFTQQTTSLDAESFLGNRGIRMAVGGIATIAGLWFYYHSNKEIKKLEILKNYNIDTGIAPKELNAFDEQINHHKFDARAGLIMALIGAGWVTVEGAFAIYNKIKENNSFFTNGFPQNLKMNHEGEEYLVNTEKVGDLVVSTHQVLKPNMDNKQIQSYTVDIRKLNAQKAILTLNLRGPLEAGKKHDEFVALKSIIDRMKEALKCSDSELERKSSMSSSIVAFSEKLNSYSKKSSDDASMNLDKVYFKDHLKFK